jgi:F-type H+-transporting ATPase subunit epsilon
MRFEVVTPEGTAIGGEADEIVAPGIRGEFGVLPGHTAFVSALKPGVLSWRQKGKRSVLAVGAGYAEVDGRDKVVVLANTTAAPDAIDAAATQKEIEELDRALKEFRPSEKGPSREELETRRAWAQARLDAKNAARA